MVLSWWIASAVWKTPLSPRTHNSRYSVFLVGNWWFCATATCAPPVLVATCSPWSRLTLRRKARTSTRNCASRMPPTRTNCASFLGTPRRPHVAKGVSAKTPVGVPLTTRVYLRNGRQIWMNSPRIATILKITRYPQEQQWRPRNECECKILYDYIHVQKMKTFVAV